MNLTEARPIFTLDVRLPVDDYHDAADLAELRADSPDVLERRDQQFWAEKLGSGLQLRLPPTVAHLNDLYRICRANLLMLSDEGEIHPGPTIYDSFWIRDSSVEGIACALAGDQNLAAQQFGYHYPSVFTYGNGQTDPKLTWGPVSLHDFFGGDHEKNDYEWDSNGQALWAIGRFDRIRGANKRFGESLFSPYVYDGALWIRDNRSPFGLLPSGWSAEHLGEKSHPHYWDDFWGLAGLWEAGQLANRIGAPQADEIWATYDTFQRAISDSIRWVLGEQRKQGHWETFIPTGPADIGLLDSTIVGTLAYFHPCRLYMGAKLGTDIDWAARQTLETIWSHFIQGGFRHDASWYCYGSYLTLQLAHAFLFTGQLDKMEQCLTWAVWASSANVGRDSGWPTDIWQVVLSAWNEQHAYPIASDFREVPRVPWYMGDIPHGWTCAELMLLLRDILFFEADEDGHPHIYLAPGVLPHWIGNNEVIEVIDAPTVFGRLFGYRLTHQQSVYTLTIDITQPLAAPTNVSFVYTCQFGRSVQAVQVNGVTQPVQGNQILLPANTQQAIITYQP